MISKFIEENKEKILNTICDLIKIPSISVEDTSMPGKPFGENCAKALDYTLNLAKEMGFITKNIDGYCGYIEFGEGEEMLGIIGHLDVVPAGDGWTKCEPFEPLIDNNRLYGRGAIDDKGPVIASLFAMKYVMDTINVNKRVRLIIGLNEEVSWKCIKYYKEHEELPTIGFSPDADFPCIYAEKGFLNVYLNSSIPSNDIIQIKKLVCDNAINIVPKYAECTLETTDINSNTIEAELFNIISENNYHIQIEKIDDSTIKLISSGVASHAAHPDLGVNALSRLLVSLNRLFNLHNINVPILNYMDTKINTTIYGEDMDLNCEDESGKLTLNVGNLKFENSDLTIGLNIRIPVTIYPTIIKHKIAESANDFGDTTITFSDEKPALYVPKNDPLVTTLCNVFNESTGLNAHPITCGGATYARAFKNVVSFGANMPGNMDLCHQADEYINIPDLLKAVEIYIKAIWKLTE